MLGVTAEEPGLARHSCWPSAYATIPTYIVDPACRIHRHQELDELGVTGLKSQDSLGITRARLAKQRLNESTALLDDIKNMEVSFNMSTT